jgi:hypothetical protein
MKKMLFVLMASVSLLASQSYAGENPVAVLDDFNTSVCNSVFLDGGLSEEADDGDDLYIFKFELIHISNLDGDPGTANPSYNIVVDQFYSESGSVEITNGVDGIVLNDGRYHVQLTVIDENLSSDTYNSGTDSIGTAPRVLEIDTNAHCPHAVITIGCGHTYFHRETKQFHWDGSDSTNIAGHDYGSLQFAWAIRYEGLTGFEETPIEDIEIGMGDIGYTTGEDPIGKTGFWYVKLRIEDWTDPSSPRPYDETSALLYVVYSDVWCFIFSVQDTSFTAGNYPYIFIPRLFTDGLNKIRRIVKK